MPCKNWIGRTILLPSLLLAMACTASPPEAQHPTRIIIGFAAPTDGADAQTLSMLEKAGGVPVEYVGAVSERSHAYRLACPATDRACTGAIKELERLPGIQAIQTDRIKERP